jgi:glycolate oxidase FAD binding subunit
MEQQTGTLLSSLTTVVEDRDTRARYAVDGIVPHAVLLPSSEAEIAAVLQAAAQAGEVVVPWGAGTMQDLGGPPERVDLVLSLEKLDRVIDYVPADMTITVEAGMRFADLEALTARHGQTVPLDPPQAAEATIGGIVATAASGPRRMACGGVRDFLLGARVALPNGRVVKAGGKVVKNVAGYDMPKLIVGSLGTLGIITEVSLKLRPLPADSRTLLFGFAGLDGALVAAEAILNSELLPSALAVLTPGAGRRLGAPGPVSLAIALEETSENNAYQAKRISEMLQANTGSAGLAGEAESDFWDRLRNYGDRFGAAFRIRVNTVIGDLEQQLQACLLPDGPVELDGIAYAPGGTVMLYGFADGGEAPVLAEAVRTRLAAANAAGGSAVLESAPAALRRQVDVWGPVRPEWKFAAAIKKAFDPSRILNRGRFVGGI